MTPRIKTLRKVSSPPAIKGLKPYGPDINSKKSEQVILLYEEYEALKLCDYDMYNHVDASILMGVSRPTFTRIFSSARQKIAKALVEGKQISIEGGKVYFDSDWYKCKACACNFNNPEKDQKITNCPLCGSSKIASYESDSEEGNIEEPARFNCEDICFCPECGLEEQHQRGLPCSHVVCIKCGKPMKRKGISNC